MSWITPSRRNRRKIWPISSRTEIKNQLDAKKSTAQSKASIRRSLLVFLIGRGNCHKLNDKIAVRSTATKANFKRSLITQMQWQVSSSKGSLHGLWPPQTNLKFSSQRRFYSPKSSYTCSVSLHPFSSATSFIPWLSRSECCMKFLSSMVWSLISHW